MKTITTFIVLYRGAGDRPTDPPLLFRCEAEDSDHAEEQCQDAEPEAEVLWVVATGRPEVALADYYIGREATDD